MILLSLLIYGFAKNVNCPIEIKPGIGFGLIEVGRHIDEIKSLGMDVGSVAGPANRSIHQATCSLCLLN